jgi:hypothetical protein
MPRTVVEFLSCLKDSAANIVELLVVKPEPLFGCRPLVLIEVRFENSVSLISK